MYYKKEDHPIELLTDNYYYAILYGIINLTAYQKERTDG